MQLRPAFGKLLISGRCSDVLRLPPSLFTGRAVHGSCARPWRWFTPSAVKNDHSRCAYMQHKYLWRKQDTAHCWKLPDVGITWPSFLIYFTRRGYQRFNPLRTTLFFPSFSHSTLLIFKGYIPPASRPCSCFSRYVPSEVTAAIDTLWLSSYGFAASGCTCGVVTVMSSRSAFCARNRQEKMSTSTVALCQHELFYLKLATVYRHCCVSLWFRLSNFFKPPVSQ